MAVIIVYIALFLVLLVLTSAITLRWRARKISNWIIPFNRAHVELWKAWGLGLLFSALTGGILGALGLLADNQNLNDLVGVGGWIAAYVALRSRLPKFAAATGVTVGRVQLCKISNQVFVYVFFYFFGAGLLLVAILPLVPRR